MKNQEFFNNSPSFSSIGKEKPILDWKLLLRREVDKNQVTWSQRRSIKENNYAYRLIDYNNTDDAETEVLIDVSGSVNEHLVKSFLFLIRLIL